MEHKLILGGEQYLPFARNCIKRLRATGLQYASQKFEIEGAIVEVRIVGDEDFIRLTGEGCTLALDSGVIDVHSIAPLAAERYLPGTLYDAGSTQTYNANFNKVEEDGSLTNPAKTDAGQLSGELNTRGRFRGKLKSSTAFAPGKIPAVPATDPPTQVPDPADDTLHAKKSTAVLCPASIFTGKTRLYVQAMYGLPLYEYKRDGSLLKVNVPLAVENSTSAAPALWLPAYVDPRDFTTDEYGVRHMASYADVLLDTSCGVWLDTITGNHWLLNPTNGEIRVYPLKSSACGERLRKYLTDANTELNATDREHLEAYILSRSLPDVKHKQTAGGFSCGAYSMGYGWHWNWDGTVADIVVNTTFAQDATNSAMRSSHYRMVPTMTPLPMPEGGWSFGDTRQTWAATVTLVEGPIDWCAYRFYWCITEPDYGSMALSKTTPQHTNMFVCDAPFYAFYVRNELKMCRIAVSYHPAGAGIRTMSPGFAGSTVFQANNVTYSTLGEQSGWLEENNNTGASFDATISIGGVVTPVLKGPLTNTGFRIDLTGKTFGAWSFFSSDVFQVYGEVFDYGYPPYQQVTRDRRSVTTYNSVYTYSIETSSFSESSRSDGEIVIPFYDAEAAYVRYDTIRERHNVGSTQAWNSGPYSFAEKKVIDVYDGGTSYHLEEVIKYSWGAGGGGAGATGGATGPLDVTADYDVSSDAQLVCHAGAIPATFTNLSEFHANAVDEVDAEFGTLSATSVTAPVVIAPGYVGSVGVSSAPTAPVIVGWI